MQPFVLPELYQPYPARVNPYVDAAREHSTAWARRMGLLDHRDRWGVRVWDEAKLDAMDCALMSAYTHPDAPAAELNLLADWYVWASFLHDHFDRAFARVGDLEGAKAHAARLAEFTPGESVATPRPTGPNENALADLWPRTVPAMSRDWRRRFAASTRHLIQDHPRRLERTVAGLVPDPIEFIAIRRASGRAPWSADLVEHAIGAEIPAAIAGTRQMRVLRDAFADGVHLLDDLFSYRREGALDNGVLVVERFLGCDAQSAADRVNDLRTSRLRQFENTAATEVPLLLVERGLDPREGARVAQYIRGLQDWQVGGCEWHERSRRRMEPAAGRPLGQPTGLGTSAARIARSPGGRALRPRPASTPGYPFALPAFHLPWRSRVNPHLDSARAYAKAWARRVGLLSPLEDRPGPAIWDSETFDSDDWPLFAALTHPDATEAELQRVAMWDVCLISFDDYFVTAYKDTRDLAGAKAFVDRLPEFMPLDGSATPTPANQVERGLADAWARTAPAMAPELRRRFPGYVIDFVGSNLWELFNILEDRVPDPVDYIEMRRRTAGTDLSTSLTVHSADDDLPPGILQTATMQTIVNAFADTVGIRNDIYSYRKEIEAEHEVNNGVLAIRRFLDCELQEAVDIAYDLFTSRIHEFERTVVADLPRMLEELGLDARSRDRVRRHVTSLQDWMAGDNQWYRQSGRYTRATTTPPPATRRLLGPATWAPPPRA